MSRFLFDFYVQFADQGLALMVRGWGLELWKMESGFRE